MLSDEEKEAIQMIKNQKEEVDEALIAMEIPENYIGEDVEQEYLEWQKNADIILNLIEKQSKEIEHQIEKRANQRNELAILNAKQVEFNKLVNTVNSYKGQFKRQQKEIEELKNGQIDFWISDKEIEERIRNKFVSKDKIKAKIEVLDKSIKVNRNSAKNSDRVTVRLINDKINELYKAKDVLQSLLKKGVING